MMGTKQIARKASVWALALSAAIGCSGPMAPSVAIAPGDERDYAAAIDNYLAAIEFDTESARGGTLIGALVGYSGNRTVLESTSSRRCLTSLSFVLIEGAASL